MGTAFQKEGTGIPERGYGDKVMKIEGNKNKARKKGEALIF